MYIVPYYSILAFMLHFSGWPCFDTALWHWHLSFMFLFCWCLGFLLFRLPLRVGGGFSRSAPSLCSRVYFMYSLYIVPRAYVVSVAGFYNCGNGGNGSIVHVHSTMVTVVALAAVGVVVVASVAPVVPIVAVVAVAAVCVICSGRGRRIAVLGVAVLAVVAVVAVMAVQGVVTVVLGCGCRRGGSCWGRHSGCCCRTCYRV